MRWCVGFSLCLLCPPLAAETHERYVLLSFSRAVDELLYREAAAGRLGLPEGFSRRGGVLYTSRTPGGGEVEVPQETCAMFVFGCHYDGEGRYFVPNRLYNVIKNRLIPERQGRTECFLLPSARGKIVGRGGAVDTGNPADWETYLWDTEDKVYRWPQTLAVVSRSHRLRGGGLLYGHKPAAGATRTLGELSLRHRRALEQARGR